MFKIGDKVKALETASYFKPGDNLVIVCTAVDYAGEHQLVGLKYSNGKAEDSPSWFAYRFKLLPKYRLKREKYDSI